MHKFLLSIAMLASIGATAVAAPITPDEALANIDRYAGKHHVKGIKSAKFYTLGYTAKMNGTATLYVFNSSNEGGYVIAAADTKAVPVLGYSEHGSFDYDKMPDNLKYWLDFYSQEIAAASTQTPAGMLKAPQQEFAPVSPIATTTWDQSAPYNDLCPTMNNRRCVTGCVATAMAQAMKCHNWPENGKGSISYQWNNSMLSANFAESSYDWENMLNSYDGKSTQAQKDAVATLMRDCGLSVNMNYSPVESGASSMAIPVALINYFDYDKGTHNLSREFYGLADWEKIVYDELAAGRPVIYAGTTEDLSGHCFLCDGYSSDRYFHINWGWSGLSDGYYRLSALTPEMQGIGGSNSGYNINQTITIGMQRPQANSQYFIQMCCQGQFSTTSDTFRPVASEKVTFTSSAFYNASITDMTGVLGVKLTDEDGNETYVAGFQPFTFAPSMGTMQYIIMGNAFPTSGTYKVTPAFRTNRNVWIDMPIGINYPQGLILTASSSSLKFEKMSMDATIKAKDIEFNSDIYSNANFSVSATLYNDGEEEYYSSVSAALFDPETSMIRTLAQPMTVDVIPGEELPLTYISKFSSTVPDGTYNFGFVDSSNRLISEPIEIEITTATAGQVSSTLTNFRIPNIVDGKVPANHIEVAGTITCESGYFADDVTAYVFPRAGGDALGVIGSTTLFIDAGESKDFLIEGKFAAGIPGEEYMIAMFVGMNNYSNRLYFTLGEPQGAVTDLETDAEFSITTTPNSIKVNATEKVTSVTLYDATGAAVVLSHSDEIDITSLPSGMYIVRATMDNGKFGIARFMK